MTTITKECTARHQRYGNVPSSTTNFIKACMIFLSGIMIGHFHGSLREDNEVQMEMKSMLAEASSRISEDSHGWKKIDVFYGSSNHSISLLPEGQKWFSQARQDEVVLSVLRQKRNGYFVDLAANDATTLSNTYVLEHEFGWKGLCIEPNPIYWYNLTHYRPNCQLVGAVVGQRRMEQVHFRYGVKDHGGIVGSEFDNGPRYKNEAMTEYTVTLLEIFERSRVPKFIDYLSLDVEGAEEFIMRNFPLQDYKVKILTVERPKENLRKLLESHGYQQIQRLSRWGETLWILTEILSELDLSEVENFNGKALHLAEMARKKTSLS